MGDASMLVNNYLTAYTSGDVERTVALLTDDFEFRGPMSELHGKEAFSAVVAHVAPLARGHRVLRQWEDGDDVSTLYEFDVAPPTGEVSVRVSEWNTVRDGKLASSLVIFDTGPYQGADGQSAQEVDPVCGMTVAPTSAAAHRTHADREYYFCSPSCAESFDHDPSRYHELATAVGQADAR
ncbi:MAG: nuclear transport factor 2 family protein [Steroidobacteraceae bacterium]